MEDGGWRRIERQVVVRVGVSGFNKQLSRLGVFVRSFVGCDIAKCCIVHRSS